MILNIHSNASYLSERHAGSRTGGIFFLGDLPEDGKPITLNGAFHVHSGIIVKHVVASGAAEAELARGIILQLQRRKNIPPHVRRTGAQAAPHFSTL